MQAYQHKPEPFIPSTEDRQSAKHAREVLAKVLTSNQVEFKLRDGFDKPMSMLLPSHMVKFIQTIFSAIEAGTPLSILPLNAELTTQEAADFLQVSRPFIVKEIEAGHITYRKIGTHRRILVSELLRYKDAIYQTRKNALDELAEETQSFGLVG